MRVMITGGTGFIGSGLCADLRAQGHSVAVLTRDKQKAHRILGEGAKAVESLTEIVPEEGPQAIVNLAGLSLASGRWNEELKQRFLDSRLEVTRQVIDYIARAQEKPQVLISGSAVGYYGPRGDEELVEDSGPGAEFQSHLCMAWENEAKKAERYDVRTCCIRMGVVLEEQYSALQDMLPPFRFGLGGHFGSGKQWMSWIHREDVIRAIGFLVQREDLSGAFNCTSPQPVTNKEFCKTLGEVLNRPVFLKVPGWVVYLIMGEMAHLVLTGQKVLPRRLRQTGFEFRYPRLRDALQAILQ